jgi:hypothetical protein
MRMLLMDILGALFAKLNVVGAAPIRRERPGLHDAEDVDEVAHICHICA